MNRQPLHVLLADEQIAVGQMLTAAFQPTDHNQVTVVSNAAELVAHLQQAHHEYEVVLVSDLLLSQQYGTAEAPGIKLIEHLKATYPDLTLLILAHGGVYSEGEVLRNGAYRSIRMPSEQAEIAEYITHAVAQQRLRNKEQAAVRSAEVRARNLEAIQQVSVAISSLHELEQILEATCRAAFELFDVDHSGLVLFEPLGDRGQVVAEYPPLGARGTHIPVIGVKVEERLRTTQQPLVIDEVAAMEDLDPIRAIFEAFGICSILIFPIIYQGQVLGSFSLDVIDRLHTFTDDEKSLCRLFAAQVSTAVANAKLIAEAKQQDRRHAQLYAEANQRSAELDALRQTTLAITGQHASQTLLSDIVQQAVKLLRARRGGIYSYIPNQSELTIVAEYGYHTSLLGRTLKLGEGMAGLLVQSGRSHIIVDDYSNWPARSLSYAGDRPFGAVVEVPLRWQDQMIGVLYVDDDLGRKFTEQDADLLRLFADYAAITMSKADLMARDAARSERLEQLSRASSLIMGGLGNITLDERLDLIAEQAATILDAEACGILLVRQSGFIRIEATHGERKGAVKKGKEFAIRSGVGTGLTGHIAYSGEIYNAYGPALTEHFAVRGSTSSHTVSGRCYSLLALPLKKRVDGKEELVGYLRVDNKKNRAGQSGPTWGFTKDDEAILQLFADAVLVVLEATELVGKLTQQIEVTRANQAKLQALHHASSALIAWQEPRRILQAVIERVRMEANATWVSLLLINEAGTVQDLVLTGIDKHFDKTQVIRPTGISRWVMSTNRPDQIGNTVKERARVNPSMFDDQVAAALCLPFAPQDKPHGVVWVHYATPQHFTPAVIEPLQRLVAEAASTYIRAETIQNRGQLQRTTPDEPEMKGVRRVIAQIVECARDVFSVDSCGVWTYDGTAGDVISDDTQLTSVVSELWQTTRTDHAQSESGTLGIGEQRFVVLDDNDGAVQHPLLSPTTRQSLEQHGVASFMAIPLSVDGEKLGFLFLNYQQPPAFNIEDRQVALTFAHQAALVLKKAQLDDQLTKARNTAHLVTRVSALGDKATALPMLVKDAQLTLNCESVVAYEYDPVRARLNQPIMTGVKFEDRTRQTLVVPTDSLVYAMLERSAPYPVVSVANDPLFNGRRFAQEEGVKACIAVPLRTNTQKVGVIFFNYDSPHQFTDDELSMIELFAEQATVAIQNTHLHGQLQERANALKVMHKAGTAIAASPDLDKTLTQIAKQAAQLGNAHGKYNSVAGVWLVEDGHVKLRAAYPQSALMQVMNHVGATIALTSEDEVPLGLIRQVVATSRPQHLDTKAAFAPYRDIMPTTQAAIAVPLKISKQVVGIIIVERPEPVAFEQQEVQLLATMATHASVALHNSRRFEDIKRMREQVGNFTAVEWMRMMSHAWGHEIRRDVGKALGYTSMVRNLVQQAATTPVAEQEFTRLQVVLNRIGETPMIAPLSSSDSVTSVRINALVQTYLDQQWQHEQYAVIELQRQLEPHLDDKATTLANAEWVRRALEIVVENAVRAMREGQGGHKLLRVATNYTGKDLRISIKDNGPGISREVLEKLFKEPINSATTSHGAGIGLLLANTIVRTYGGELRVAESTKAGTEFEIRLPIEGR